MAAARPRALDDTTVRIIFLHDVDGNLSLQEDRLNKSLLSIVREWEDQLTAKGVHVIQHLFTLRRYIDSITRAYQSYRGGIPKRGPSLSNLPNAMQAYGFYLTEPDAVMQIYDARKDVELGDFFRDHAVLEECLPGICTSIDGITKKCAMRPDELRQMLVTAYNKPQSPEDERVSEMLGEWFEKDQKGLYELANQRIDHGQKIGMLKKIFKKYNRKHDLFIWSDDLKELREAALEDEEIGVVVKHKVIFLHTDLKNTIFNEGKDARAYYQEQLFAGIKALPEEKKRIFNACFRETAKDITALTESSISALWRRLSSLSFQPPKERDAAGPRAGYG